MYLFDDNNNESSQVIDAKQQVRLFHKHNSRSQHKNVKYQNLKRRCQTKLREMQNNWRQQKAIELQGYANIRDLRRFYEGTKELFRLVRSSTGSSTWDHQSVDSNTILTDPQDILQRWREDFLSLLNQGPNSAEDLFKNVPKHQTRYSMIMSSFYKEYQIALNYMEQQKSPGPDNISVEYSRLLLNTCLFTFILRT